RGRTEPSSSLDSFYVREAARCYVVARERSTAEGGVISDDDSRDRGCRSLESPDRPMRQEEGGRQQAHDIQPDSPSGLLEIPADEWDLLAQRPQLPAPRTIAGEDRAPVVDHLQRDR